VEYSPVARWLRYRSNYASVDKIQKIIPIEGANRATDCQCHDVIARDAECQIETVLTPTVRLGHVEDRFEYTRHCSELTDRIMLLSSAGTSGNSTGINMTAAAMSFGQRAPNAPPRESLSPCCVNIRPNRGSRSRRSA